MGRGQSPIANENKLKLGFFSPNCSSGMAVTKVDERWVNSWDNNIELAEAGRQCRHRVFAANCTVDWVRRRD